MARKQSTQQAYVLADCAQRAKEHPETFLMPSPEKIAGVTAGDHVKLIFEDEGHGERMWVKVRLRDGERLIGVLANKPIHEGFGEFGSTVTFELKNIADVMKEGETTYAK